MKKFFNEKSEEDKKKEKEQIHEVKQALAQEIESKTAEQKAEEEERQKQAQNNQYLKAQLDQGEIDETPSEYDTVDDEDIEANKKHQQKKAAAAPPKKINVSSLKQKMR